MDSGSLFFVRERSSEMKNKLREQPPDLHISLTSMLDLVFNILAFFVMTYQPPLATKDYEVNLPAPKPQGSGTGSSAENINVDDTPLFNDLNVKLTAGEKGELAKLVIENKEVTVVEGLQVGLIREIQRLNKSVGGIEAINIASPATLKYRYLVSVVEACEQAGIRKINFAGKP